MSDARGPAPDRTASQRVEASLITNGVTWYLRSNLVIDDTRLTVTTPRTVLGLIPVGVEQWAVGLRSLVGIRIGTKLHPDRLAVAVVLGLLTVFAEVPTAATAVLAAGTAAMLLLSLVAVLRVEVQNGALRTVPICLIHIPRASTFAAQVEARGKEARHTGGGG